LQLHIIICCDVTFRKVIAKFTEKVEVELSKIDMYSPRTQVRGLSLDRQNF